MDAHALIAAAVASGSEGAVEVNQRDLIDKMLARYASDHGMLRELLQNADDAKASEVEFRFTTTAAGRAEKAAASSSSAARAHKLAAGVIELREINNGIEFSEQDWVRVARIAEGNPSEDSVGMFGVGFYSVFSVTESPLIVSGSSCLAFKWAGCKLATFRSKLPAAETLAFTRNPLDASTKHAQATTAVMLPMREVREWNWEDLKPFFARAMAFITHVSRIRVVVDGAVLFMVQRDASTAAASSLSSSSRPLAKSSALAVQSASGLFSCDGVAVSARRVTMTCADGDSSIELTHVYAKLKVEADSEYRAKCFRIMKKQLPAHTVVQLLYPTSTPHPTKVARSGSPSSVLHAALCPLKRDGSPAGRVFIGLSTHQSTGTAFHAHAQLVPTVERENVDFQDPYLGRWNEQLLDVIGQLARGRYEDALACWKPSDAELASLFAPDASLETLSPAAADVALASLAEPSHPAVKVGDALRHGFLRERVVKGRAVPILLATSAGVRPANVAFLPACGMEEFMWQSQLSCVPIVPPVLTKLAPGFYDGLASSAGLCTLNVDALRAWFAEAVLQPDQVTALLRWIPGKGKSMLKGITRSALLEAVTFLPEPGSTPVAWSALKHYVHAMHPSLPVPASVLPPAVCAELSASDLNSLGLKPLAAKTWLSFIDSKHRALLCNPATAPLVLAFLSSSLGAFTPTDWQTITSILRDQRCIPVRSASKPGVVMALPSDAMFVPAASADSADLEVGAQIVALPVFDSDSEVARGDGDDAAGAISFELLKRIGVRRVSAVASTVAELAAASTDFKRLCLLRALAEQWPDMDIADQTAIQTSPLLPARVDGEGPVFLAAPADIVFPHVLTQLRGTATDFHPELTVLHMPDVQLKPGSDHFGILRLIGVRMFPPLPVTLALCARPGQAGLAALSFFLTHFRLAYSSADTPSDKFIAAKVTIPFLACTRGMSVGPVSSRVPQRRAAPPARRGGAASRKRVVVDESEDEDDDALHAIRHAAGDTATLLPADIEFRTPTNAFSTPNPFVGCLHPAVLAAFEVADVTPSEVGVKPFPTVDAVLALLRESPPTTSDGLRDALVSIHEHCAGLTAAAFSKFASVAFIPSGTGRHVKPTDVFVAAPAGDAAALEAPRPKKKLVRGRRAPDDDTAAEPCTDTPSVSPLPLESLSGLVDFIDIGEVGNAFLRSCGATAWPTPAQLMHAIMERLPQYQDSQPPHEFVQRYRAVLVHIGEHVSTLTAALRNRFAAAPVLPCTSLATPGAMYFLPAAECVLIDDPSLELVLHPRVPEHASLYKLCTALGCPWLSAVVSRVPVVEGTPAATSLASEVQARISSRAELLVRSQRGELLAGMRPGALEWLGALRVLEAPSVGMELSFQGKRVKLAGAAAISTCVTVAPASHKASSKRVASSGPCIVFVRDASADSSASRGVSGVSMLDVATELCRGLFNEEEAQSRCMQVDFLLSAPVDVLRKRGVPVERFLAAAADAPARPPISFPSRPVQHSVAPPEAVDVDDDDVGAGSSVPTSRPAQKNPVFSALASASELSSLLKCTAPSSGKLKATVPVQEPCVDDGHSCMCDVDLQPHALPFALDGDLAFQIDADAAPLLTPPVLASARAFAMLLRALAQRVFGMRTLVGLVMFADVDSSLIAFNSNGQLFFNLRCFVQQCTRVPYGAASRKKSSGGPAHNVQEAISFWWVVMCHELVHNRILPHDQNFNNLHEALLVKHAAAFNQLLQDAAFVNGFAVAVAAAEGGGVAALASEVIEIESD